MNTVPPVGSIVRYNTSGKADPFRFGRVYATEVYTHADGTCLYIYVRWFCPDGGPDKDTIRHHPSELIIVEP